MSLSNSSSPPQAARRILAASIGGLGDTILFSPVLKALRSRYPEAHIELLLASPLARIAFTPAKEIDRIFVTNTDHTFLLSKAARLLPYSLRSRLSGGFDLGVFATGLNPNFISLLSTLARIRRVYCAPKPPEHETDLSCNISLARRFEPAIDAGDTFFPLSGEAFEEARHQLSQHGIPWDGCNIIAVYPSRDFQHRPRWPLRKMVEVIKLLKQRGFDGKIVVVGSLQERKEWEASDSDNVVDLNLAGRLSISAVGALLSRCTLVLGNDGGIMHVAGAVGCPLVILMTTTAASYRPAGKKVRLIQPISAGCVSHLPGLVKQNRAAECADSIEVEAVLQACLDQLALMQVGA
jgi:ADP-heptose:LPS heptosyltransferase